MSTDNRMKMLAKLAEPWVRWLVKRGFDAARAELYATVITMAFFIGLAIAVVILVPAGVAGLIWWVLQ